LILKNRFTTQAKQLRKNSTDAERLLWSKLRYKQIDGYKFRRQQPIGPYIVDFANFQKKLIIELDGGQHSESKAEDLKRDEFLKTQGFSVLRFWNNELFENLEGVLHEIRKKLETPSPGPSRKGRGEKRMAPQGERSNKEKTY
jgi:very-short-patch-repair endonuclease